MQQEFFHLLQKAISENRLSSYRCSRDNSEVECYALYLWNIALSESFYPALHGLEVTLRNSIHNAASNKFGNENWFDQVLQPNQQETLKEIKDRLSKQSKPSDDINQLVASSSFGFWVSLFNKGYEVVLWHSLLKDVFPYMPNESRTRKVVSDRLNQILVLQRQLV